MAVILAFKTPVEPIRTFWMGEPGVWGSGDLSELREAPGAAGTPVPQEAEVPAGPALADPHPLKS